VPSEAFIDLLLAGFPGQIASCNLVDGLQNGVITEAFAGEVLEWWEHLAAHRGYSTSAELFDALNILRDRDYPMSMPTPYVPPDFRFQGPSALAPRELDGQICCAVPAGLLGNVLAKRDRDRLVASGVTFPAGRRSPWVLSAIDALMNLRDFERVVRLDPTREIGRSVLWFTRKTSITNMLRRRAAAEIPDRVRDGLGLVHRSRDEVLVLLLFPANILRGMPSARPTFVDAGNHSRFKSTGKSRRADASANWGWTTQLEKFYSLRRAVDGCRERVCASIVASVLPNGGEFAFECLGVLLLPRNDIQGTLDQQFADALRGARTVQDLKDRLLTIP
jgi:hypothetical protein